MKADTVPHGEILIFIRQISITAMEAFVMVMDSGGMHGSQPNGFNVNSNFGTVP
jgi:hypothetical protein